MGNNFDAIIVGAGISGLIAANHLEKYNLKVLVIDKSDRAGGRVKTDEYDGYRFDRGFQVLLTGYPEARKYLDYDALDLQLFNPGALCFNLEEKLKIQDTSRNKLAALSMAFSKVGTVMDKLRLKNLKTRLRVKNVTGIFNGPEISTYDYLKELGFSEKIIDRFFRPFFSGIFLENDLSTSARMFEFVFKMFNQEYAAIPARGMEEIPRQLKRNLKNTEFRFQAEVDKVESKRVTLKNGDVVEAPQIIVASPPKGLIPQMHQELDWRGTATYYFAADISPLKKNLLALNYRKEGLVSNFTVLSDTAKDYAPQSKSLISVSLREIPHDSEEEVSQEIKNELAISFGPEVQEWEYLRSYKIEKALPIAPKMAYEESFEQTRVQDGIYLAGDHLLNPSLNAAMKSGEMAAKAVVLNHCT